MITHPSDTTRWGCLLRSIYIYIYIRHTRVTATGLFREVVNLENIYSWINKQRQETVFVINLQFEIN